MAELITSCPVCAGELSVSVLNCDNCGLSLQNKFHLSRFNYLNQDEMTFLLTFLKYQGNFKMLQDELNISYPYAKKKMKLLLQSLELNTAPNTENLIEEEIDMTNLNYNSTSNLASDIIKRKLLEYNGRAIVTSARGISYEIRANADGVHFECNQLPINPPYEYKVFDIMVDCLIANGGKARKGNGRNFKLGHAECDDTTLVGYIAKHYAGKPHGSSVFDPVFVLVSILEWADIAHNGRGVVEITASHNKSISL